MDPIVIDPPNFDQAAARRECHDSTSLVCHRCGNPVAGNDYTCPHCQCVVVGGIQQ